MIEIVVYFDDKYSMNESIWVSASSTRKDVVRIVNEKYGDEDWYSFDII